MRSEMNVTEKLVWMVFLITTLSACATVEKTFEPRAETKEELVFKGLWRVEDIDQGGVIDYAMVTLEFVENGRIAGSTGCNRYTANLDTDDGFVVSKASSTKRACPPAIAKQEQRFLLALNDATSYQFEAATWLNIYDTLGQSRLKLIEIEQELLAENPKMDQSETAKANFQCEKLGSVKFRFLGPETIEITVGQRVATLQRKTAASGAKYTSADMMFWNHGSEALLRLDDVDYPCEQILP